MKNSLEQYNKNFSIFYDNFLTGIAESMALFYIEQLNLKEDTGTVLDLMCGTGTLLNIFTDIGWTGTGVDLSSEMLNIARKKDDSIRYIEEDATMYLDRDQKYQLVTCTADALNHLNDISLIDKLFYNVFSMLTDDGYFVFDMNTLLGSIRNDTYLSTEDENGLVIRKGFINPENTIGYTNFSGCFIHRNNNYVRFKSTIVNHIYEIDSIVELLHKNRLHIVKIFDAEELDVKNSIEKKVTENYERIGFIVNKSNKF
ncbi:class I SAM-dependent methyltransferase [Vagococcus lutrae]|uniref:class I SAM-dependent DNA methyltransferase n=1 Tax=Vagococcus lutrae TaxID=81947 RepID=UPI001C9783B5|nr:class I SAM-dependent methyltransferase [Vagococcus lutrae]MDT2818041.1 class I SAM-dependent methyltransferase [Vagococcus lutrae]QZN88503.1 class I SAM-dependent methyltransferase [Vagococcus lutrae]